MKYSVQRNSIIEIGTAGEKNSYRSIMWILCLTALLVGGNVIAFTKMWGDLMPGAVETHIVVIVAFLAVVFTAVIEQLKKRYSWARLILLAPWVIFLIVGVKDFYRGIKLWYEFIVFRWEQIHNGGASAINMQVTDSTSTFFSIGIALIIGMAGYLLIKNHKIVICFFYEIMCLLIFLMSGTFNPLAGTMVFTAFIGMCISTKNQNLTRRSVIWIAVIFVVFCLGAQAMTQAEIEEIHEARDNIRMKIHVMRYGEDVLPEGDLRKADELKKSDNEMLTVKTEQEKSLYLRGFVGSIYLDGKWIPLSNSSYGGNYSGMIRWLGKQNLDPLKQSSHYMNLGKEESILQENKVEVNVTGASRCYTYVPSSLNRITQGHLKEKKDARYVSRGFFGEREYRYEEQSGSRPSELMVTDSWVTNPDTKARSQYSNAEAVYRNFVYDNYVSLDSKTREYIKKAFWSDYKSENDGIYSALDHIRKKLTKIVSYVDEPVSAPSYKDPLVWMLEDAHEGNDVMYASVAVAALRAYGIPARYVEGYYLPAERIGNNIDEPISLTGKDAHAWLEVYFDGVGWQPVDVTPGYYYDALSLSRMINSPDMKHKSAAIKNERNNTGDSDKMEGANGGKRNTLKVAVRNIAIIVLGALIVLIAIIYLFFLVLELGRIIFAWWEKKKYLQSDINAQVLFIEQRIFILLSIAGIKTSLGWNTEEVDKMVAERFDDIKSGEYERMCEIIERSVYGGIELKPYEMRTIQTFLTKLGNSVKNSESRRKRIMLRYVWIHKKWLVGKLKAINEIQ